MTRFSRKCLRVLMTALATIAAGSVARCLRGTTGEGGACVCAAEQGRRKEARALARRARSDATRGRPARDRFWLQLPERLHSGDGDGRGGVSAHARCLKNPTLERITGVGDDAYLRDNGGNYAELIAKVGAFMFTIRHEPQYASRAYDANGQAGSHRLGAGTRGEVALTLVGSRYPTIGLRGGRHSFTAFSRRRAKRRRSSVKWRCRLVLDPPEARGHQPPLSIGRRPYLWIEAAARGRPPRSIANVAGQRTDLEAPVGFVTGECGYPS